MTYRLTPQAQADIDSIADYISSDNPLAAVRLVRNFALRWELLATQPFSGAPCGDVQPGVRHIVSGQYITFYRVEDVDVVILRVLHGRRNVATDDIES